MPSAKPPQPPWLEPSKRLRAAFERSGISQNKLASRAGIDPATLGDMLTGKRIPRPESLRAVCRVLNESTVFIKTGVRDEPPPAGGFDIVHVRTVASSLSGIESWLSRQTGICLDEQQWLRAFHWPMPHICYPDPVYAMALQLYRSMLRHGQPDGIESPSASGDSRIR